MTPADAAGGKRVSAPVYGDSSFSMARGRQSAAAALGVAVNFVDRPAPAVAVGVQVHPIAAVLPGR
jgi:hypothetical protein